jgi:hypothetical protein
LLGDCRLGGYQVFLPPALGFFFQAHGQAEQLGKIEYRQGIRTFLARLQIAGRDERRRIRQRT